MPLALPSPHPLARLLLALALTLSAFSLLPPGPAQAATVLYVDAAAVGANNGSSWTDAYTDLQAALLAAVSGDEIWVAAGVYTPGPNRAATFQLPHGVAVYGGFPPGGGAWQDRAPQGHLSLLSGDIGTPGNASDNSYHVVSIGTGATPTTVLDGFTILSGNANSTTPNDKGGGVFIVGGSPVLQNLIIRDNAAQFGGGLYASNSSLILRRSTVSGNASSSSGGGMDCEDCTLLVDQVTFANNRASTTSNNTGGGGLRTSGGSLKILSSVFSGNVNTCSNNPSSCGGGGLYTSSTVARIVNTQFLANTTTGGSSYSGGGGLYAYLGSAVVQNSIFSGNSGAVYLYDARNDAYQFANLTFFNNGISVRGDSYCSRLQIKSSILWDTTPLSACSSSTLTYSIVQGGSASTGNLSADPQFVNPQAGDFRLKYSSPAIDAGDNRGVQPDLEDFDGDGNVTEPLPVDLAGRPRFAEMPMQPNVGAGDFPLVDMGAYEVSNTAPTLDKTCSLRLPDLFEDQSGNGVLVSSLLTSHPGCTPLQDADPGATLGLALTDADLSRGSWQFSTDGGASWQETGTLSTSAALLLGAGPNERLRFLPAPNFSGSLNAALTLRAWDGSDGYPSGKRGVNLWTTGGVSPYSAASDTASLSVLPTNDPPAIDPLPSISLPEDSPLHTLTLTGIHSGAPNEQQTISLQVLSGNPALIPTPTLVYTSPNPTATLSFAPLPQLFGTVPITLTLSDDGGRENGGQDFATQVFTVTVNPVNDPPSFEQGADPVAREDAGPQMVWGFAAVHSPGPDNEALQSLSFSLQAADPSLFAVQPEINAATGDLSYTPAPDAWGTTQISVTLQDSGGTAYGGRDTYRDHFNLTLQSVNDLPSFEISQAEISLNEDAGTVRIENFATNLSSGPPNEAAQKLTFNLTVDTPALFSGPLTLDVDSGELSFRPAPNASGTATVGVELRDNGGVENGGLDSVFKAAAFTLFVRPINDPPSMTFGPNPTVFINSGPVVLEGWAAHLTSGAGEDDSQSLTISLTTGRPNLFSVLPAIDLQTGNLSFTPARGQTGTSSVEVELRDSGDFYTPMGMVFRGTFTITIQETNEPPLVTSFARLGMANQTLVFSPSDFVNHFSDPRQEALVKVKILSLPEGGQLLLGSEPVMPGQEIARAALNRLIFVPAPDWTGSCSFFWNASDGMDYASAVASVTLTIQQAMARVYLPLTRR